MDVSTTDSVGQQGETPDKVPRAYYNELDPYAAQWLRNLIAAGHIAPGDVDTRSIVDVRPADLVGYTQCHFFAGIGGWSLAARLAGWPDNRPVWTGSCPCQPFSVANKARGGAKGRADERHLWPSFFGLICECRPSVVFGEQVVDAINEGWLDEVTSDLESEDYTCGAVVLPALAVKAKHQRKRLWWVADTCRARRERHQLVQRLSIGSGASLPVYVDPLAGARRALDGDYEHLLLDDGVSITVERAATKGYGNAIVPQVAAEIIGAYLDTGPDDFRLATLSEMPTDGVFA